MQGPRDAMHPLQALPHKTHAHLVAVHLLELLLRQHQRAVVCKVVGALEVLGPHKLQRRQAGGQQLVPLAVTGVQAERPAWARHACGMRHVRARAAAAAGVRMGHLSAIAGRHARVVPAGPIATRARGHDARELRSQPNGIHIIAWVALLGRSSCVPSSRPAPTCRTAWS